MRKSMDQKFVCDYCGGPLIFVHVFERKVESAVDPDSGALREPRNNILSEDYYVQCQDPECPGPYWYNYSLSEDSEHIEPRWR